MCLQWSYGLVSIYYTVSHQPASSNVCVPGTDLLVDRAIPRVRNYTTRCSSGMRADSIAAAVDRQLEVYPLVAFAMWISSLLPWVYPSPFCRQCPGAFCFLFRLRFPAISGSSPSSPFSCIPTWFAGTAAFLVPSLQGLSPLVLPPSCPVGVSIFSCDLLHPPWYGSIVPFLLRNGRVAGS